jgi:hypothetical protein
MTVTPHISKANAIGSSKYVCYCHISIDLSSNGCAVLCKYPSDLHGEDIISMPMLCGTNSRCCPRSSDGTV